VELLFEAFDDGGPEVVIKQNALLIRIRVRYHPAQRLPAISSSFILGATAESVAQELPAPVPQQHFNANVPLHAEVVVGNNAAQSLDSHAAWQFLKDVRRVLWRNELVDYGQRRWHRNLKADMHR